MADLRARFGSSRSPSRLIRVEREVIGDPFDQGVAPRRPCPSPASCRRHCAEMRCTVLRLPPMTPLSGETSLATIQSQPLDLRFFLAYSMTCSVSAAKPMTSARPHARLLVRDGLQDVGVLDQLELRRFRLGVFLDFFVGGIGDAPVGDGGREDPESAGNAWRTAISICSAVSICDEPHAVGQLQIDWARDQRHARAESRQRRRRAHNPACRTSGWRCSGRDRSARASGRP